MANTFILIEAQTLSSAAATVTFSSIPQTYTDLKVVFSARSSGSGTGMSMSVSINGSSANFVARNFEGDGSAAASGASTNYLSNVPGSTATASAFGNVESYFPNYTSANYKSFSTNSVTENNATNAYQNLIAGLWSQTAAITELQFAPGSGNFITDSTFYLYGIKNS